MAVGNDISNIMKTCKLGHAYKPGNGCPNCNRLLESRKKYQKEYDSKPEVKAKRNAHKRKMRLLNRHYGKNKPYNKFKKNQCECCGFSAIDPCQLDVDHVDGNHSNNDPSNLQTICANCHRLKTFMNKESRNVKFRLVD